MKKLSQLNVGEKAIIASFEDDAVPVKLLELGCLPGNHISLHSVAPLKDPICVELEGKCDCLEGTLILIISLARRRLQTKLLWPFHLH